MRRIISLVTIAALLSVSSVPLMPKAAICHAAEANTDCDTCHTDRHASHDMPAHSMHAPGDQQPQMQMQEAAENKKPQQLHKHQKQLTAAEKDCRIECGCGCNRSVDGLPHLLAPHVATTIQFESGEQVVRAEPESYPVLMTIVLSNPPPPPRSI